MKIILVFLFVGAALTAKVAHTYTMGASPVYDDYSMFGGFNEDYQNLNYRYEGTIDVDILYTTNHLATWTDWCDDENCGWESSFDSFYEGEMKNLYLQFEIPGLDWSTPYNADADDDDENRCLVCMNVDENSELRDGDEGFAVCYNTKKGNFFPYTADPV